jgi:hypothetical protein
MAAIDVFDGNAIDVVVTDNTLLAGEPHGLALARMIKNKRTQVHSDTPAASARG